MVQPILSPGGPKADFRELGAKPGVVVVSRRGMALKAIRNQSLNDQIFEQLGREIMLGRFAVGAHLPPERTLGTTFGVNRHVVREALKRLEQIGLIRVTQGEGTVVLDFRRTAGLDLLALMAEHVGADADVMSYWLAVHEMRAALGADAARLCAERGSKALKQELLAIADRMAAVGDGPELFTLEIEFWTRVIDGSGNIAYRLGYNTLIKAVLSPSAVDLARTWSIHEIRQDGYRALIAKAIAAGNAKKAEAKTRESMNLVVAFLKKQLVAGTQAAGKTRAPARTAPRR
jgi:GntR family transcriptional repressor for pyruvate dehydrogenase complex